MMTVTLELPAETKEYITTKLRFDGPVPVDASVEVAVVPKPVVGPITDWHAAEFDDPTPTKVRYLYPGDLPPGLYEHWIRITTIDSPPERPVRRTGFIRLI